MATRKSTPPKRAQPGTLTLDNRSMVYAHGQHAAYVLDRCRCEPCKASNATYEKDRRGRIEPPYVLATQAREHVLWLATQGLGRKQIAKASGVAHGTLCKLIYGDPKRRMAPSKRIRPETHDAIMAVVPADNTGNLRIIPAGPTWVLLDEMIAAGIPQSTIGKALGNKGGLQISRNTVGPANRDKVKALHDRWRSGDWLPVRRDRHGNSTPKPAPRVRIPAAIVFADRQEAYDNQMALYSALADAVEARIERPWRDLAACRGRPSRMWFPQRGDTETANAAIKICKSCLCRRECLMANLGERDGIYGGTSARERRRLRNELTGAAA